MINSVARHAEIGRDLAGLIHVVKAFPVARGIVDTHQVRPVRLTRYGPNSSSRRQANLYKHYMIFQERRPDLLRVF